MAIPEKSNVIDRAEDQIAIFGHIMATFGQIGVYLQFWARIIVQANFMKKKSAIPEKAVLLTHSRQNGHFGHIMAKFGEIWI